MRNFSYIHNYVSLNLRASKNLNFFVNTTLNRKTQIKLEVESEKEIFTEFTVFISTINFIDSGVEICIPG